MGLLQRGVFASRLSLSAPQSLGRRNYLWPARNTDTRTLLLRSPAVHQEVSIYTTCYTLFVCVLHAFTFFRAAVERNILGLRDIVPLTPYEMGKSLGPGYKAGVTKSSQSNVELC